MGTGGRSVLPRPRRGGPYCLGLVLLMAGVACSGDDDPDDAGDGTATSTTMATGGIEVAAPEGWTAMPVPLLGFGVALPPGWEATRLDEQGLASTSQAEPLVPGFADAAHNAAAAGALFYAAGVDATGAVTDLKVTAAALDSGVTDLAGLEAFVPGWLADSGLASPVVETLANAPYPSVQIRFQTQGQRPADGANDATMVDVSVEGTERLVLSPSGVIYSLIVTSEDASGHDDVANQIVETLAFPP